MIEDRLRGINSKDMRAMTLGLTLDRMPTHRQIVEYATAGHLLGPIRAQ